MRQAAAARGVVPSEVSFDMDPALDDFVRGMAPVAVESARADALGLPRPPALQQCIEDYIDDYVL